MSEITNLRQAQRRISQLAVFEDGLWDLLLGSIFLFLAVYPVTRELLGPALNLGLFLSLLAVLVAAHFVLRRLVSEPRIGYARSRRTAKLRILVIITAALVLITFGLVLVTFFGPGTEPVASAPPDTPAERGYLVEFITLLVLGLLFSALGFMFGVKRLYVYGWLLGIANLLSIYMVHNTGWVFLLPLAIASAIILSIGVILLVRFLGKYAAPGEAS